MKLRLCLLAFAFSFSLRAEDVALSAVVRAGDADSEHARPALNKNARNQPLRIAGHEFASGVGTQVDNATWIDVAGATRFIALAGVDDATERPEAVYFEVLADGRSLWHAELKKGDAPAAVDVEVRGAKKLTLITQDLGNNDTSVLADWADAKFSVEGEKPKSAAFTPFAEVATILTPRPPTQPRINGARVFGVRPGHPFFFQIAATGEPPIKYSATDLPAGLKLDADTGRITGVVAQPGTHTVTLHATNARGGDEKKLRIEIGEKIALTPPMGWNSWNSWGISVDQEKVLASARAMSGSGLIDHGWTYVNIDDTWQGARTGPDHALQGNEKFPDLKKLCDLIHGLGLKVGIYSTPWETSYASFAGGSSDDPEGKWSQALVNENGRKRRHHGQISFAVADAKQWAAWGIDYLKYDWNPKNSAPPETAAQFHEIVGTMTRALRDSDRDIVYSYSNSFPFEWIGENVDQLHAWRTTGDINDTWGRLESIGFSQDKWRPFGGPGHWNDPDMLVVGNVDVGRGKNLHPPRLTPNEQYTHISLWCLQSAPLLIGCPMEQADDFTLSLLTNDEVLALDQDELGKPAAQVVVDGRKQVWVKELADGSRAIGLFNLAQSPQEISVTWKQLGLDGPQRVRALWAYVELGVLPEKFSARVPRHGVMLIRVWPVK